MTRRPRHALAWYLAIVSALGLPVLGYAASRIEWSRIEHHIAILVAMTIVLIAGEMAPVPVPRGDDAGDEVSISSTVAMALLLIAPGYALLAQAAALTADEARARRQWERLPFNIGQYSIALGGAWLVYSSALGSTGTGYDSVTHARALPAALAAGVTFFVLNNTLTAIAIALKVHAPIAAQIAGDLRHQMTTSGVLLALAPVMAIAVKGNPLTLPLLLLPLVAVHRSARLAFAREHEALHDALTGLANRTLFSNRLAKACDTADVTPVAAVLIDIDHFKEINDTLGHAAGDMLLIEIAQRLRQAIRDGDLVARLGGDEFAILAYGVHGDAHGHPLLVRLQEALSTPVTIHGVRVDVSASVGVAIAPMDATEADGLLQRADVAMYSAKRNRGSTEFYEPRQDEHSIERLSLLGELRDSLDRGDVFLVYQPKIVLTTGAVCGVEALARWRHPLLGDVPPDRFIALAENTGLIGTITVRLLEEGLRQLEAWRDAGMDVTLAVNLSARLLADAVIVEQVAELLQRYDVPPRRLVLEVTESMLMADVDRAMATLRRLRVVGVQLSIDDFGTGYSSLGQLKRFPVDELKIDRTFVMNMSRDPRDASIAAMAINLAHEFGLTVVAEGVEDETALKRLEALGCDHVQGYHIARPMPAAQMTSWMQARLDTRDELVG